MQENRREEVIVLLGRYEREDIKFDNHARMQATVRGIYMEEIANNIMNPSKMFYAREQKAKRVGERKFDCYFGVSKKWAHRYVIVINEKLLVITVIKVKKNWQKWVDKHAKV